MNTLKKLLKSKCLLLVPTNESKNKSKNLKNCEIKSEICLNQ